MVDKPKVSKDKKYFDSVGRIVVMGIIDGYVMAKRPRCMPFVASEKEFLKRFKEAVE